MSFQFEGFSTPNGTLVPDEVFDILAPELTEAELRVLLYIIRRTFGFKKSADNISLKQMIDGIQKKDGTVLDRGTGMSKSANWRGIKGLQDKGIITSQRNSSGEKGDMPTTYSVRFKSPGKNAGNDPIPNSSDTTKNNSVPEPRRGERTQGIPVANDPVFSKRTPPGSPKEHHRVLQKNTQETVWQKTDFNQSNIRKQHAAENHPTAPSDHQPLAQKPVFAVRQDGAFEPVGAVFQRTHVTAARQVDDPSAPSPSECRDAIRAYLKDIALQFNDQAPLESSVSRAYNLYVAANLPLSAFLSHLLETASSVRERLSKVKNRASGGKATTPYYFACLADRLGLRPAKRGEGLGGAAEPAHTYSAQKWQDERAQSSPASASSLAGEQGGNSPPPHTHSFTHPTAHAGFVQSGQSSVEARSASAAPS